MTVEDVLVKVDQTKHCIVCQNNGEIPYVYIRELDSIVLDENM